MAEVIAVIGAVASVASIAAEGIKLSHTLSSYVETVRHADKSIAWTADDVRNTSIVLEQFAANLKVEEETMVCKPEFYRSVSKNINDCDLIFKEIDSALALSAVMVQYNEGEAKVYSMKGRDRFQWPFKQQRVALLGSKLDRLKTTLNLMMTVMMHARDFHNKETNDRYY